MLRRGEIAEKPWLGRRALPSREQWGRPALPAPHASPPTCDSGVQFCVSCRTPGIIDMRKGKITGASWPFLFLLFFLRLFVWMISETYHSRKRGINSLCGAIAQCQQLPSVCLPLSQSASWPSGPCAQACSASEPRLCPPLLPPPPAGLGWRLSLTRSGLCSGFTSEPPWTGCTLSV